MVEESPDAALCDLFIIADHDGCQDVIDNAKQDDAKYLLYEFYRQGRLEQNDDEKVRVIKHAADLIRSDIKNLTGQTDIFFHFTI